jgi:hypothetical protein
VDSETGEFRSDAGKRDQGPGLQPAGISKNRGFNVSSITGIKELDTVSFRAAKGRRSTLRFLIDTGAHISTCKESSLHPGDKYDRFHKVKGISTATLQTLGSVNVELEKEDMYTNHKFQVVSDCIAIPFDAILGRDFWDAKGTNIDFENRIVQMGKPHVKFDDKDTGRRNANLYYPKSETMIEMPTSNDGNSLGVVTVPCFGSCHVIR